jgi:hypothetical protein
MTFETADIYRYLTGEEDTVPEFQYNWTTSGSSQHANYSGQHCSSSGSSRACTTSILSTESRLKQFANHKQSTHIANPIYFRYQAKTNTASKSPKRTTRPFRSFHLRHCSTAFSNESSQPEATLQGRLQGPQYPRFTI